MFSNSKLKLLQSFFDIFVVVCLSQKFVQSANIIFCISIRKRKHNLSFWHFNAFTKTVFSRLLLLKRHRLIELEEILFLFSKPHKLIVMVPSELLAINPWFEFCQDKKSLIVANDINWFGNGIQDPYIQFAYQTLSWQYQNRKFSCTDVINTHRNYLFNVSWLCQ